MNIIRLKDDIWVYSFDSDESADLTTLGDGIRNSANFDANIMAIIDNDNALLIDSSIQKYAYQVKNDLKEKGITVKSIIFSHFHTDHIEGRVIFQDAHFYGYEKYEDNFKRSRSSENTENFVRFTLLKNGDKIKFGHHHIKVFNLPGHTAESLITIIDRQFLHIGDLLIMNNAGKYYLPLVGIEQDSLENYIESLKKLQEYSFSTVILGHGPVLMGKNQINESIERNLYYLTKLKEIGANAEISNCVKGNLDEYIHVNEYHQQNLNNITKHYN
ncbi:MAG: MBL fold metallo-hydrolase [Candidatus Lokiarchaeota archaeon]|nr:MBL fold metallo-hydrolase [Candidatus Harpocratesius repetitus]